MLAQLDCTSFCCMKMPQSCTACRITLLLLACVCPAVLDATYTDKLSTAYRHGQDPETVNLQK